MARHILVINGHPDPAPGATLCGALARAYAEGAEATGHSVRRIDIGSLEFPILRSAADFASEPREPDLIAARGDIAWLGGPPALLKAFMEQIARADFVLAPGTGFPRGKLKGRSARVIVTMGMPAIFYRLLYGAHGVKAFNSAILGLAGIRPIATSLSGGAVPGKSQTRLVERIRALGRRGA
jgi:putative NADPH-quinone reductase